MWTRALNSRARRIIISIAFVSAPGGRDRSHVLYFARIGLREFPGCFFNRARQFRVNQQRRIQRGKLRQRGAEIVFVDMLQIPARLTAPENT